MPRGVQCRLTDEQERSTAPRSFFSYKALLWSAFFGSTHIVLGTVMP